MFQIQIPFQNARDVPCSGNVLLYRMVGAEIYLAPPKADVFTELLPRVQMLVEKLK